VQQDPGFGQQLFEQAGDIFTATTPGSPCSATRDGELIIITQAAAGKGQRGCFEARSQAAQIPKTIRVAPNGL
jgi:hypothetical protein